MPSVEQSSNSGTEAGLVGLRVLVTGVDSRGRLWPATMREDEVTTGEPLGTLELLSTDGLVTRLEQLAAGSDLGWTPDDDFLTGRRNR